MKLLVWLGLLIGGLIGGWLGSIIDHGNWFGLWSIGLSSVGSVAGIWLGYKVSQAYLP